MATKREAQKALAAGSPRRKRVKVETGQIVAIPLSDGSYALAHIAQHQLSIWCVLFGQRSPEIGGLLDGLDGALASPPIAVMQVTSIQVRDGSWPVIAVREPNYPAEMLDTHGQSAVGTVLQMLAEAYHGLRAWDELYDPKEYDRMLLPGVPVPPTARYKRDFEKDRAVASSATSIAGAAPADDTASLVTDGPAEIHIEIKYPGEDLPSVELLHRRQALERTLEGAGAGEVTEAGGGGGVMDIYLRTEDVRRATPVVMNAIKDAGFEHDAKIEVTALSDPDDADE